MSFQKTKTDPKLGLQIDQHLLKCGVATPVDMQYLRKENKEKIDFITQRYREIWRTIGMDLSDDSITETPLRMAKVDVLETFWGLIPENFPKCTAVENKMKYDEMVVERKINVMSRCEHHGVVIDGFATVGYIPNETVLGLSKLNRVVEYFSKRPQIQERLTEQIYHALQFILDTDNVAVIIDAEHYCVKSRGVEDVNSSTVTSKLGGVFKSDPATRQEFLAIFHNN